MTQAQRTILVVDDDTRLRVLLDEYLCRNNFSVISVESAHAARMHLCNSQTIIDLAIFDVMMPGESGISLLMWLRAESPLVRQTLPVIMLTACGDTHDRIQGLHKGADDYLGKPFEPEELILRITNILKRMQLPDHTIKKPVCVTFGDYTFDMSQQTLCKRNVPIPLTTNDRCLLNLFAHHMGELITRENLAAHMGVELSPRSVDVQIARLRQKIEPDPKAPLYLVTERHKGYVLKP